MGISTAVDLTRVSRVVGYKVKSARFEPITPYLPQRIALLGEANSANQAQVGDPFEFINANQVGEKYGYGSPLHQAARILRPLSGDPLGGIKTFIYPQAEAGVATAGVSIWGVTAASATANATHKIIINGRDNVDGQSYAFSINVGDDAAAIRQKIIDVVNSVIGAPCTAAENATNIEFTNKWASATSTITIRFDTGANSAGVVYAESSNTGGTGVASITDALSNFGENWNTLVLNSYGAATFSSLEAFNGIPDPDTPTGRYEPTLFKPFLAFYGSSLDTTADIIAITNASARRTQVTNVHCPAPNSEGLPWEAAANMIMTFAPNAQNRPHLDNGGKQYPDMPVPSDEDIGDFSSYASRDQLVKSGSSTVNLTGGKYTVQDCVTTYAPEGDVLPKFRFARDLNVDWNVGYNTLLIMLNDVQDKAILPDNVPNRVDGVIKPKDVRQAYGSMIDDLAELALIADAVFSKDTLNVQINETNPARLDMFFRYKRTSTAHIASTDAEVDFNFTT